MIEIPWMYLHGLVWPFEAGLHGGGGGTLSWSNNYVLICDGSYLD